MKNQSIIRIFLMIFVFFAAKGIFLPGFSSPGSAGVIRESPAGDLSIGRLSCEHMTDPLQVPTAEPRLSWVLNSMERDQAQTAYQVLVASSPELLTEAKADLWNSGKVASGQSVLVKYAGEPLSSRDRCCWKVRAWDKNGRVSGWSETAFFGIGLLEAGDWQAEWIRPDIVFEQYSYPAPMLRKEFNAVKDMREARLYITSLGLYRASLNGKPVGDLVLTPGWTSYANRVQYQMYEVGELLQKGANAIGIQLGNGWYRAFRSNRRQDPNDPAIALAARAQLEIIYADGSRDIIKTDGSWKASTGPIRFSEIYDGEVYDARLEKPGWDQPAFDDSGWAPCIAFDPGDRSIVPPASPPMRRIGEFTPVEVLLTPEGDTVLDMGQNMVGWVRLRVECPANTRIELRHAEVLDKNGNFYTENLRRADQKLVYICKGQGMEVYEPFFTFQGFRYVAVSGYPGRVKKDMIRGIVVHSDLEPSGSFSCNDSLINQLQHNIVWGQKGNFLDVPTDCPQRDERLGWTGDAQVFAPTACFNKNCAAFYTKWLADLALDQHEDGAVPKVIPNVLGRGGEAGWQDAATVVPWTVYRYYGDTGILKRQYPSMKALVEYMRGRAGDAYVWGTREHHYGDWLAFATTESDYPGATTDKDLLATAYFYHSTDILQKSADILGYRAEALMYRELMEKIKAAFAREFLTPNGRLSSNTQTAYVVALSFGLIPEELEEIAAERLVADVRKFGHLTTGFLGTPDLCHVLTRYGYLDEAYMLLYRKEYPSWLYPITRGATTIWERWDGQKPDGTFQDTGMNSFNHYAYGAVGDWLYRKVAGIDMDPQVPGFKRLLIKPHPEGKVNDRKMNNVHAFHESPYGKIEAAWRIENGTFTLDVSIPVNTRAEIYVPSTADVLEMNGKQIKGSEKVGSAGSGYHFLMLVTGSGSYSLTSEFKPR